MRKVNLILLHILTPLSLGALIYIAFRNKSLTIFRWFDKISISEFTDSIRNLLNPLKNNIPDWVIFSLPDGLWVYSFTSFLIIIWKNNSESVKYWMILPFAILLLIELLQLTKIFTGTCDFTDIYISFLALIISVYNMKLIPQIYERQTI